MILGGFWPFLGQCLAEIVVHDGVPPVAALPDGVLPPNATQICALELAVLEVGKIESCLSQVSSSEIGSVKSGLHQVGFHHGGAPKVAASEVTFRQIRPIKNGSPKIRTGVSSFPEDGLSVVLVRIIHHNGLFGRCFIVSWVTLSATRHDHAFTSSVGALVEVCLAFGCKDCESVFVVFACRDFKEPAFFESIQIEG